MEAVLGHHLWLHSALLTHRGAGTRLPLQPHSLRRLPPTGRLSLLQVGEATGQVSYTAFSQHETSTRLLGEQEACRGGSGPEGLRTGISAQVWAFLLFSQSVYCTNQVGFSKKAVEVIKWVERCKHAENLKQFFSKVPKFSTICKEHSPMWTFKASFPTG